MPYVDGFVLPVPKKKVDAYKRMARKAGKVWREHGASSSRNASPTMCQWASSPRFRAASNASRTRP